MKIAAFYWCHCGKLHMAFGTNQHSVCECGRNLWDQLMSKHLIMAQWRRNV